MDLMFSVRLCVVWSDDNVMHIQTEGDSWEHSLN
jgi:hypothetical protein